MREEEDFQKMSIQRKEVKCHDSESIVISRLCVLFLIRKQFSQRDRLQRRERNCLFIIHYMQHT